MRQESRRVLAEQLWLRVSYGVQTRYWLVLQSSEGLTEAGGYDSKAAPSCAWQVSAGCGQEALVSHPMDPSIGLLECLHNIVVSFPQSE